MEISSIVLFLLPTIQWVELYWHETSQTDCQSIKTRTRDYIWCSLHVSRTPDSLCASMCVGDIWVSQQVVVSPVIRHAAFTESELAFPQRNCSKQSHYLCAHARSLKAHAEVFIARRHPSRFQSKLDLKVRFPNICGKNGAWLFLFTSRAASEWTELSFVKLT